MDAAGFRAAFPVLRHTAFLNAGTCGPYPEAAAQAAADAARRWTDEGRSGGYYMHLIAHKEQLRAKYAALLHADAADVALTTCTSEGVVRVLTGFGLQAGDEVVTADDEHPGVYGPLASARDRLGVRVRVVPLRDVADAVSPATRLVVCSHVSWASGEAAPAGLRDVDVPVLLDGAQGVGAVPVEPAALGATFYAGSGQKWLCGPVGVGMLWIAPAWRDRLAVPGPTYLNLADPKRALDGELAPDARRHDAHTMAAETLETAMAALAVFEPHGWPAVHERAATLAAQLADALTDRGHTVAPRGPTTLVAWGADDPIAQRDRLAAAGVGVRDIPATGRMRASVGAWNDESDLERLLGALPRPA